MCISDPYEVSGITFLDCIFTKLNICLPNNRYVYLLTLSSVSYLYCSTKEDKYRITLINICMLNIYS